MTIKILKKGDRVLSVTEHYIVVERKNHEVDVIPLINGDDGVRIDTEKIITIGYGDNVVETVSGDVLVTNF